jgi:hypothetical protein
MREHGLAHAEAGQIRHDREQTDLDDEAVTPGRKHVVENGRVIRQMSFGAQRLFGRCVRIFRPCDDGDPL